MEKVTVRDLGRIAYPEAWDLQKELLKEVIDLKLKRRDGAVLQQQHYFLYCEHPHVYTLGKSGKKEHLLLDEAQQKERQVTFHKINRGGDITYHGPGQVVGYPIFDLDCFFTDIHKYVRYIEEAAIRVLSEYGITGERIEGLSGVWLKASAGKPDRKICAVGIHLSRWVTMHGFAFNVNTDLAYFGYIVPCGIVGKSVTSLSAELGYEVDMVEVKGRLTKHFSELFGYEIVKE